MELYKSPQRKVVTFLKKSRLLWKRRSMDAKAMLKVANKKVTRLETTRSQLKAQVKALKSTVTDLEEKFMATDAQTKKKR